MFRFFFVWFIKKKKIGTHLQNEEELMNVVIEMKNVLRISKLLYH